MEVWPENWPTFTLFCNISTQWLVGPNGAYGLNYLVLYRELDDLGVAADERQRLKNEIRAMESAALEAMRDT